MIVSAKETKTGECELYISFRRVNSTWSAPVSLGPKINDGVAHRWGQYVTPDGKYLFYSRGTSAEDCTLYWVRFDRLLKKLRPKQLSARRFGPRSVPVTYPIARLFLWSNGSR
jgi:hypothetical protein